MKKLIFILAMIFSLATITASAQKAPEKKSTAAASVKSDTLAIPSGTSFIKIDSTTIINVPALASFLKTSYVSANDEYWYNIYSFFKGSKNADYSSIEQDKLMSLFMPFVERYIRAMQENQKRLEDQKAKKQ